MKRFLLCLLICVFCLSLAPASAFDQALPRGCRPSPRHKILAAPQHRPTAPPPAQVARVPAQMSFWGNDQFGCCVTTEEAFSKACEHPEIFLATTVVVDWARQHGFLNGADLVSVMEAMQSQGFAVGSQLYNDGGYATVDYSNETTLQSAIAIGNVKIAIDASALPSSASNQQNGWYVTGGGNWPNTDHCVSICGYGPAEYLFSQLKTPTPATLAGTSGYLVSTWNSIGFVDHAWLMSAMAAAGEAFVRNPTTVFVPPLAPTPPTPTPAPPSRLTFAELIQLLIVDLFPHLTQPQADAVAAFFAEGDSPRVGLLKHLVYQRGVREGLICPGDSIDTVNWQELITIIKELEPLILPLIPLLFGDEQAALPATPFALCAAEYRTECGPDGCHRVRVNTVERDWQRRPARRPFRNQSLFPRRFRVVLQ